MTFLESGRVTTRRGSAPRALGAALVAVAVGTVGGLLWQAVAPRVEVVKVDRGFVYAQAQPEQPVAADAWFGAIGLVSGLVLAILAWALLRRHRGLPLMVGLVLGSLVGAWLGWRLGVWLDRDAFLSAASAAQVGDHLSAPLSLGMSGLEYNALWPPKLTGIVLAQPLAVAIAYTTLAGFSTDPRLRPAADRTVDAAPQPQAVPPAPQWTVGWPPATEPGRTNPGSTSSGQAGSAGPTGWPAPPGSG